MSVEPVVDPRRPDVDGFRVGRGNWRPPPQRDQPMVPADVVDTYLRECGMDPTDFNGWRAGW